MQDSCFIMYALHSSEVDEILTEKNKWRAQM